MCFDVVNVFNLNDRGFNGKLQGRAVDLNTVYW